MLRQRCLNSFGYFLWEIPGKKMLRPITVKLFNRFQNTSRKSLAHIDLKNNEYKQHAGAHAAQFCFHDARGHYGCWYHIQYVLKPFRMYWFIYERHQIVSHSAWLMLSPILVLQGWRWWWGQLVGNVVMSGCAGGLSSERWGRREGRVIVAAIVAVVVGGCNNNWAKQNREEAENNLKVRIDPAPVIVHIFHSPTGPIPVSLKCKGKGKGN